MREGNYTCKLGTKLRESAMNGDVSGTICMLKACIGEIVHHYEMEYKSSDLVADFDDLYFTVGNDQEQVEDWASYDGYYDEPEELVNADLEEFYDLCDEYDIWVEM